MAQGTVMSDSDLQSFARIIGGLEAQVASFQANWIEQDRRASDGRKFLFEKVDGVGKEVQHLTHTVADVVQDVAEMKPAVKDWVATKNQAIGASGFARVAWALIGGLVVLVGWLGDHFFTIIPHLAGK